MAHSSHHSSTLYTIGTALNMARDHDVPVKVLVSGHWLEGKVIAIDGHGLVLTSGGQDHSVVRMQDISVVQVARPMPAHAPGEEMRVHPLPGPEGWARVGEHAG